MGLLDRFRKKSAPAGYDRPEWMKDGMSVSLYEGRDDLEIVGESYHQDELWRVVGGRSRDRVREDVAALLVVEPDNQYDSNAIGVWIGGWKVGHLSRSDAAALRPGLLDLEGQEGKKIALEGVVVGGGVRDDGIGNLGVFLRYDPEDFGLASTRVEMPERRIRTEFSDAPFTDDQDDSYDLGWYDDLSENDLKAIKQLRELLLNESDPIDLHFMYRELEARLYKSRDVFSSALDEYDGACREHDEAMERIRPALLEKFDQIPLLETYKQQAIRCQKAHDFESALWWAERGIDLYGDHAADPAWVQDLEVRARKFRAKIDGGSATPSARVVDGATLEALVCHTCGQDFERERARGRKPHECPACRGGGAN